MIMKVLKTIGICFVVALSFVLFGSVMPKGYTETGHEDFKKIVFVGEGQLLKEYSTKDIENTYSLMASKAFGWDTVYFNYEKEAVYDGTTIFAKTNKSNKAITFDYVLREAEVTSKSVTVKGSVSTKITGNIKKIDLSFSGQQDLSREVKKHQENTYELKTSISFTVQPYKKLTLLVTGRCYITNGVSRYKFMWITFQKGAWETIDVDSMIYELREEKV